MQHLSESDAYLYDVFHFQAIVMRTFGSGNAPQSPWFLNALREGTRNGKVIVNISQCLQGAVEMSRYDCARRPVSSAAAI